MLDVTTDQAVPPLHPTHELSLGESAAALIAEFGGQLPPGQVLTCIVRCRESLRRAGVRDGLATATAAMARARLLRAPARI